MRAATAVGDGLDRVLHAETVGDALGDRRVDVGKLTDHAGADCLGVDLAEFEDEGGDDVVLLRLSLRVEEHEGLGEVVGERGGADAELVALFLRGEGGETVFGVLTGRIGLEGAGGVRDAAFLRDHRHVAVALHVGEGAAGAR